MRIGPVSVELAAVRERKRAMVAGARQDYASRLAQDGLDLIEGEAHFSGRKTVEIALTDGGTRQISAAVVVIDAGTRPRPLAILRDDGITILTSSVPVRVEPADVARLRLTVRTEDGERQLEGSHLLSAIGRIPNTESLTPEAAGIRLNEHGFIEVDEYLETAIFAHPLLAEGLNTLFATFDA